jgi:hypothetical protein
MFPPLGESDVRPERALVTKREGSDGAASGAAPRPRSEEKSTALGTPAESKPAACKPNGPPTLAARLA